MGPSGRVREPLDQLAKHRWLGVAAVSRRAELLAYSATFAVIVLLSVAPPISRVLHNSSYSRPVAPYQHPLPQLPRYAPNLVGKCLPLALQVARSRGVDVRVTNDRLDSSHMILRQSPKFGHRLGINQVVRVAVDKRC